MSAILVLGGGGAVGREILADLRSRGHRVGSAGRSLHPDPAAGSYRLDIRADPESLGAAAAGWDAVINASGLEDRTLPARAPHALWVDISATGEYLAALARPGIAPGGAVLGVGIAPGITGILAAAVVRRDPGPIDTAILLGSGEKHGPAALDWTFGALGQRLTDPETGEKILAYTRPRRFRDGTRWRTLTRVDFADPLLLSPRLGVPVRTYFATESRLANAALRIGARAPIIAPLLKRIALPGSEDWWIAAHGRSGTVIEARGSRQSLATALVAARATEAALNAADPGRIWYGPDLLGPAELAAIPGITVRD